jgi:multiple sugar transport system substrate-binding protein
VLIAGGCGTEDDVVTLRFWAMGREGEVVQELVYGFEQEFAGVRVDVQQIPWSAAHEKLLTAYVGRSTPDLAQLGNTWIAEFVALRALQPLDDWIARSEVVGAEHDFAGIWDTNVIDDVVYGVPWYVDTRVLFYRRDLLQRAGYETIPATWDRWREAMRAVQGVLADDGHAIFLPINEWNVPVILGLQAGSELLDARRTHGAFESPAFREAFRFYVDLFRDGLAPPVANNEIANVYQEFAKGSLTMYVTGPWNLGEFARRLPDDLQDAWATSALPGPSESPGTSLAGGSSLVMFERSAHPQWVWRLIEYLSRPEQQIRFYRLTGDLPARTAAWEDSLLRADARVQAFHRQLHHVMATPKIPEWEQIATKVLERSEQAIRGVAPVDSVLAALDRDVDRILEKRRWLLEHGRIPAPEPSR